MWPRDRLCRAISLSFKKFATEQLEDNLHAQNYFRYNCASPWHLAISGSEVVDQPDYTMYPSKYVVPILEVER